MTRQDTDFNPRQKTRRGEGRAAILAATKALLWERGYEHMSPADVLARSGAGQGSLYHHFPTKFALASAALAEMVEEEKAAMNALFAAEKPAIQRLGDYLARKREARRGCRIGRLANETVMEQPEWRALVAAYLDHVEGLIRSAVMDAQTEGAVAHTLEAAPIASMLLSVIEGGFILARAHWDDARMSMALRGAEAMLELMTRK